MARRAAAGSAGIARLLLVGSLALLSAPSARAAKAPRIPVKAFFSNPAFSAPVISPDGKQIAVVRSQGDLQVVLTRDVGGKKLVPVARLDEPEMRLAWLGWANPQVLLASASGRYRESVGVHARLSRLFSIIPGKGKIRWLGRSWPQFATWRGDMVSAQFEDQVIHWLPKDPEHVLVAYRHPVTPYFEATVKRMNVRTGRLRTIQGGMSGIDCWYADRDGNVRAGTSASTTYRWIARIDPDADFQVMASFDAYDGHGPRFAGFSSDPRFVYVMTEDDGRRAIHRFDLARRALGEVVFAHPEVDVDRFRLDERTHELLAVGYVTDEPHYHFLDPDLEAEQHAVNRALPGTCNERMSRSDDGQRVVIQSAGPDRPPRYYLYDRADKRLSLLVDVRPDLPLGALARPRRVTYPARDGVPIPAYLTLPRGLPPKKLPLIVLPHGEPFGRDWLCWNPEVQLLANRGFAVIQPNFRGSRGYGRAWREAGYREFGGKMEDDLIDAVRWLVAEGIADPDRVGIYGTGFGGYTAMMALVEAPDLFRAGASNSGVMDLDMSLGEFDWYYLTKEHWLRVVQTDRDARRAVSPLHQAARIHAPVLLAHGTDDPMVNVRQSRKMAAALKDAGVDVTYLEFPHEVHEFVLEKSRIRFYEALVAFFEKNLAPRPAPSPAPPPPPGKAPGAGKAG